MNVFIVLVSNAAVLIYSFFFRISYIKKDTLSLFNYIQDHNALARHFLVGLAGKIYIFALIEKKMKYFLDKRIKKVCFFIIVYSTS